MEKGNLFSIIRGKYDSFSKSQKKLAEFVLSNCEQAVFMTASRLGSEVGVSESTTVRFAMELGYEGFPEFRKALEEVVLMHLNSVQRVEVAYSNIPEKDIFEKILISDVEKIKQTLEICDKNNFLNAVSTLKEAKRVYIIGIRSCAPLASFLSFYLNQILDDVRLISTNNINEIFEQMIRINEKDVVVGISFPRYSMRTLKAMEFANKRNARIVTITDSIHSPINLYSSCTLLAKSDMASIVDSLVAPLSLINALIVALCMENREKVVSTLTDMEKLWDEYQIYNSDDMDPLSELQFKRSTQEK